MSSEATMTKQNNISVSISYFYPLQKNVIVTTVVQSITDNPSATNHKITEPCTDSVCELIIIRVLNN